MAQKTKVVRLPGLDFELSGDQVVELARRYDEDWCGVVSGRRVTWIRPGARCSVGASFRTRDGEIGFPPRREWNFFLEPGDQGIAGNGHPVIYRQTGWRGTTNGRSVYAEGVGTVRRVRVLKSGDIAVTVALDAD